MVSHYHTFHGVNEFEGVHINYRTHISGQAWDRLKEILAQDHDLDPNALSLTESYWGGKYGDDDGAELVTYEGKFIGAFDRRLLRAEVALIESIPHFGDVRKTTDADRAAPDLSIAAE